MGTLGFSASGLQNGAPDGLALLDPRGVVLDFISYEGSLSALQGPAAGRVAVDIGVEESSATAPGSALSRAGQGGRSTDFGWQGPAPSSRGAPNANQSFDGCAPGCTSDAQCDDGLFCNGPERCDPSLGCTTGAPP